MPSTHVKDPFGLRESDEAFPIDVGIEDPIVKQMIDRAEDEYLIYLLDQGVSEKEFLQALDKNPEGFIQWVRLSLASRH